MTQEVFIVAHRRLHELQNPAAIKPWLYQIAFNVAREHRRNFARKRETPGGTLQQSGEVQLTDENTPETETSTRELSHKFSELMLKLSEEQREVFWMAEVEDMSAPEISEALGISVNTVYSRHRRAKDELSRALPRLVREGLIESRKHAENHHG